MALIDPHSMRECVLNTIFLPSAHIWSYQSKIYFCVFFFLIKSGHSRNAFKDYRNVGAMQRIGFEEKGRSLLLSVLWSDLLSPAKFGRLSDSVLKTLWGFMKPTIQERKKTFIIPY